MKTNTEINMWEIRDNKYNLIGNAKPKCWEQIDRIVSVSNVYLTDKECSELTDAYKTIEFVKVKIGEEEAIVNGTDLIIAIENALNSDREVYDRNGGRRRY